MSEQDTPTEGSFDRRRRTVLKAVGAGSALSAFAGVGAASEHGSDGNGGGNGGGCWCPPCIDRLSGYTALADDDESEWPTQPDHVVDMYVEPRQVLFQQIPTEETDVEPGATPGEPKRRSSRTSSSIRSDCTWRWATSSTSTTRLPRSTR